MISVTINIGDLIFLSVKASATDSIVVCDFCHIFGVIICLENNPHSVILSNLFQ